MQRLSGIGMILSFDNPNPSKGKPFASLAAVICQRCKRNRIGRLAIRNRKALKHGKQKARSDLARQVRHRQVAETSDPASGATGNRLTGERNKRYSQRRGGQDVAERKI
jgi:hypothetical protein